MAQAMQHWLMKAEPDSRVVKGKDVKFSVDDFEAVKTTPWEGVRNHEAKNLMKGMKVGDKVLFYHSNCKTPGIAAFAEVSKEAYPDYTAWNPNHPYYDPKTDQENPKWYMVEITFTSRARHFVPLALLRHIADTPSPLPSPSLDYLLDSDVKAIKGMALVKRGRLSVQKVDEKAWDTIQLMTENGGWDELKLGKRTMQPKAPETVKGAKTAGRKKIKKKSEDDDGVGGDIANAEKKKQGDGYESNESTFMRDEEPLTARRKRKAKELDEKELAQDNSLVFLRRSTRVRKW